MYTGDVGKRLASYRVDEDLLAAVTAEAAERGETVTDVVIRAFQAYIHGDEAADAAPVAPGTGPAVCTVAGMPVKIISDGRMPPGLAAVHSGASVAFMDIGEEPPQAPACKHPVASVNEFSVCRDCGADVW